MTQDAASPPPMFGDSAAPAPGVGTPAEAGPVTFWEQARARLARMPAAPTYLVIALVWGLILCVVVPPFQQFDEVAHYYRAWSLASGHVATDARYMVSLPAAVAGLPGALDFIEVGEGRAPYSMATTFDLLGNTALGAPVRVICFAGNPIPLGHLPAAAGVGTARLFRVSPLAALYAARIINVLAAVLLVFFAIRTAPFGRPLFVLVGLLPMTMTQFAAVNPDALTIAGAMLFLAVVLRLSRTRHLTTTALALLVVGGSVLLNVKPGYQAFALLGFLIPWTAFGSRRRWAVWLGALLVATFAVAAVNQLASPSATREVTQALYGADTRVDTAAQTEFLLSHPSAFLHALRTTAGTQSLLLATNMVGILGRGFIPLSQMAVLFVLGTLVATLVSTRDGPSLSWLGRGVVLAVCGLTTIVLGAAMYVESTAVGAGAIAGLQGRYFIPVLAVGLFAVHGLRQPPRWILPIILVVLAVVLALSSLVALGRYYY